MPQPKINPKKLVQQESNAREVFYTEWLAKVTGYEVDPTTVRLCLRLQSPFRRTKSYAAYQEKAKSARVNAEREAATAKLAELDEERARLHALLNGGAVTAPEPPTEPSEPEATEPALKAVEDEPGDAEPPDDDDDFAFDDAADAEPDIAGEPAEAESVTLDEPIKEDGDEGSWGDDDDPDDY